MSKIEIAPMLDWTTKHYRYFMRQITTHTTLYTEMVVCDAIIHGNLERLLEHHHDENPLVLQLGGSDPQKLANASKIASKYNYNEINLNVGCPSSRVKSGNFGACLMSDPHLVKDCLSAMKDAVNLPITIKHRIGLGYEYSYDFVRDFVGIVSSNGCNKFVVHARNAILDKLSPKQNREIPPLEYEYVYKLKQDFPQLEIILNGGVTTLEQIKTHLTHVDGVMLGREAYYNPYLFATIDNTFFASSNPIPTRLYIAKKMLPYLEQMLINNIPLRFATYHMLGLYHGCPHAKIWRQTLTDKIAKSNDLEDYIKLLELME